MQNFIIETDKNGLEMNSHGDSFFPLAGYDEYFSKFVLKEVPWHWHNEIEMVIVIEGSTKVEYVNGSVEIKEGEGIFINSNILHRMTQTSLVDCHIINFVFKPEFIGGRYDSRIYNDYIKPICSNHSLSTIKLTPKTNWETSIIEKIKKALEIYTEQTYGYEILIQSMLLDTWYTLCTNQQHLLKLPIPTTESKTRLDKIITFIHCNYNKKIAVKDLASIADISESECYRLFRKALHMTPNDYILTHRMQVAVVKLIETNHSVLTIAYDIGFGTPSYFSKKFKQQYNMTPKDFRTLYKV